MSKKIKDKKTTKKQSKTNQTPAEPKDAGDLRALNHAIPARKSDSVDVAAIFAVALLVRIVFFLLSKQNNPLFYHPIMDSLYHHEWAINILSGNFWGGEVFFRAPLYPYFLALLYKISGSSIAFAVFCQHLLGCTTAIFIYFLAREYFTRNIALLSGIIAALYWPFIYFEGDLLIVNLILLLDVAFLWCMSVALRRGEKKLFVIAGMLLGLSAIARPSVLIFVIALPIALRYAGGHRKSKQVVSHWKKETALVIGGILLFVLPVIVRNYVVGRDIVPIASQGGVNFYIGNNPNSDGRTAIVPGTRPDWWGGYYDTIDRAEKAEGRSLKPSEVSNYYFREGIKFMTGSPAVAAKMMLHKFHLFWAGGERSNNKYIYFFWDLAGMGKFPLPGFWLITPLALLGGILQWRRRRILAALYLFVLTYMAGVVAFFVNARFRLPVVPVLIILASYAVFHFIATYKSKSFELLKAAVILLICFAIINYDFLSFQENKSHEDSISHYSLGNAYLKLDKKEAAIASYETARNTNRRYPRSSYSLIARNVDYNLGLLYWEFGRCRQAIEMLERIGGSDEYTLIAMDRLADCYAREGRIQDSIDTYNRILSTQRDPNMLRNAYLGLARIYDQLGQEGLAREYKSKAQSQ
jgi:4-amino-4-deoxy-L-arabinose transferase-like glycosyltransferase